MATSLEIIQLRSPLLAANAQVESYISQAEAETSDNYPSSDLRNKAIALLVLHWLALEARDSAGSATPGAVVIEKEGSLMREYSNPMDSRIAGTDMDTELFQTRWGIELFALQKKSFLKVFTRMN